MLLLLVHLVLLLLVHVRLLLQHLELVRLLVLLLQQARLLHLLNLIIQLAQLVAQQTLSVVHFGLHGKDHSVWREILALSLLSLLSLARQASGKAVEFCSAHDKSAKD